MERRLAAILEADVVGFSRLMERDETGTLAAIKALWSETVDPNIAACHGRVVKTMGDGVLVEFASVVHAVSCAIAIQNAVARSEEVLIRLRIGINIGDIVIDGADIYGDGVNVTARLQAMAPPGGIAVSEIVHESIGQRDDAEFADAGRHKVRNISRPIHVWTWSPAGAAAERPAARPAAADAEKFMLAVVGIESLSDDERVRQLATGLTRDIATDLGRFSQFELTTVHGDEALPGPRGSAAHAADYALEGAIQGAGDRVRVSVHVTDTRTGRQVWSQRYDGDLDDLFDFQDRTTQRICGHLFQPLMKHAALHARGRDVDEGRLNDLYLRSRHAIELPTEAGVRESREACEKILAVNPGFTLVYEHLAWIGLHSAHNAWVEDPVAALREGRRHAVRGIALDSTESYARSALGMLETRLGNAERGIREAQTAEAMNPNDAEHATFHGASLGFAGKIDAALAAFQRADALSPGYPPIGLFRGEALVVAGRSEEAVSGLEQFVLVLPEYNYGWALLAAACAEAGDTGAATHAVETIAAQNTRMTAAYLERLLVSMATEARERIVAAARAAGLPAEEAVARGSRRAS